MQLVLFRHGIAEDRSHPRCPPDAERALTEQGIRKTRSAVHGLARLLKDNTIGAVFTSPYKRARETADILLDGLDLSPRLLCTTDTLIPEENPLLFLQLLQRMLAVGDDRTFIVVGHSPHLNLLSSVLFVGHAAPDHPAQVLREEQIDLKKAGAACFHVSSLTVPLVRTTLLWHMPPRMLRQMD